MEISQAQDFISQNHRGVMMTVKRDGSPQLSPILIGLGGVWHRQFARDGV